jgi:opacity protein-like surface antigen
MRRAIALVFIAALLAALPAAAQDPEKKVNFNVGGGYTFASGKVRDNLGDGFNFNAGVWINVLPIVILQAEYSFNGLGQKQVNLPVSSVPAGTAANSPFYLDMNMQFGDLNLVFRPKMSGKAQPYILAGVGIYYRPLKVTTPSVGYVPGFCDPWWFYCQPGGFVEIDKVVGSRSSTDMGMDVGGGVNYRLTDSASMYFEVRYHYIWGPHIYDSAGKLYGRANGQFLPITFGVRF